MEFQIQPDPALLKQVEPHCGEFHVALTRIANAQMGKPMPSGTDLKRNPDVVMVGDIPVHVTASKISVVPGFGPQTSGEDRAARAVAEAFDTLMGNVARFGPKILGMYTDSYTPRAALPLSGLFKLRPPSSRP